MSSQEINGPPPELEERVVRSLRERGRLGRGSRGRASRIMTRLAAGILLVIGGMALERVREPSKSPSQTAPRYVLLLYGHAGPTDRAALVDEYRRWVASVRTDRRISGEELGDEALVLAGRATSTNVETGPSGYFVFEARDMNEAKEIAGTCPHLRHGGRAVLRPIVPS